MPSHLPDAVLLIGCCWVLALATPAAEVAVHVAPTGDDRADGSAAAPVRTLEQARQLARSAGAGTDRRIVVHGGRYQDVQLTLESRDAGLVLEAAPGEHPVLIGGVALTGWRGDGDGIYAATLPERGSPWEPRMLVVDGVWCPRARLPATGTFTHETTFDVKWMSSTGGGWQRKPTTEELTTLIYKTGDLGAWFEPKSAEITVFHMWDESCVGVAGHDPDRRRLTLEPACGHPPGAFGVKKYVVWNLREGLTAPGQWCHDRIGGRILYRPLPGQDLAKAEVLVPTRTSILTLRGTAKAPVTNITVRGLGFTVTTVPLIAGGFAAANLPGAVSLDHADHCTLESLDVGNVAGHGIDARGGTGNTVTRSTVHGCGAGGVYVGGTRTVLRGNHIRDIGLAYPSAIGIYRGGTDSQVVGNEIHGCSYSGINYGGTRNRIENNLVYDCMRTLHDGAGIYLFAAKDCILTGNLVRDITDTGGYGASAYYLDERSEGCLVEGNGAVNVPWISQNHMAKNNTYRNNVFVVTGDAKFALPKSEGYTFERNVIRATGRITFEGGSAITTWASNILSSGTNTVELFTMKDYRRQGPAAPAPEGTVTGDPRFTDPAIGDFRFLPGSPAPALGIAPVDLRRAGRP